MYVNPSWSLGEVIVTHLYSRNLINLRGTHHWALFWAIAHPQTVFKFYFNIIISAPSFPKWYPCLLAKNTYSQFVTVVFSPAFCHYILLRPKYIFSSPCRQTSSSFVLMGWDYVCELRPLTGLLFIPQMLCVCAEPRWNDIDRVDPKNLEQKSVSVPFCTPQIRHGLSRGCEPGPPQWDTGD